MFRWLEGGQGAVNFSCLPFGYGSRSCIGRSLAETQIIIFLIRVFSSFQVFRDHADMDNPIVRKLLLDWINFDNYDASVPFYGEVWVEEEHLEEARMMTEEIGGAEFTFYPIDNVQGRVDLNNWE